MKTVRSSVSLLLVFAVLFSVLPLSVFAESPVFGAPVSGEITFLFPISYESEDGNEIGTETVFYSDEFFSGSACVYRHDLATASLAASMTGSSYPGSKGRWARQFMLDIGCAEDTIFSHRFSVTNTFDDECAFAFGLKSLPGTDKYLLVVINRGNNYIGEWASNVRIYDGVRAEYASGFRISAEYEMGYLESYIEGLSQYGIEPDDLRLWVTGYSRGAAIANNLGQMIDDWGVFAQEDVFVYTFATPATVDGLPTDGYQNIFNICSELDVVPRVPLAEWGFTRFGTTYFLPCRTSRGSEYDALLAGMQQEFHEILDAQGFPEIRNHPLDRQECAIDLFLSYLSEPIASQQQYRAEGWQAVLEQIMIEKYGDGNSDDLSDIILDAFLPSKELAVDLIDLLKKYPERTPEENILAATQIMAKLDLQKAVTVTGRDLELIRMFYDLVRNFRTCLLYEKITDGQAQATRFYSTMLLMLLGIVNDGVSSPLLMQHWPESYLAWMRSGTEDQLFRTVPHSVPDIRTPMLVGDVNGDDDVTAADALLLNAYLLCPLLVKIDKKAADVDGNGRINLLDAARLTLLVVVAQFR